MTPVEQWISALVIAAMWLTGVVLIVTGIAIAVLVTVAHVTLPRWAPIRTERADLGDLLSGQVDLSPHADSPAPAAEQAQRRHTGHGPGCWCQTVPRDRDALDARVAAAEGVWLHGGGGAR
jgi:hypothetical protein